MKDAVVRIHKAGAWRRELILKLRQLGFRETCKLAARRLWQQARGRRTQHGAGLHPFDIEHGTDTSGIVEVGALDLPEDRLAHAVRYQTAIVEVFLELLSRLSISHEGFTFVDLGSGKGRALLLASRLPFKAIVGVELSASLHETACRNIQVFRDPAQRCHEIKSVCEDAARFTVPDGGLVFYLFNPFDEQVMRAVVANIEASFRKSPRKMYLLYLKPVFRSVLDRSDCFQIAKETERYLIYETKPLGF